jgi:hypothetical protein
MEIYFSPAKKNLLDIARTRSEFCKSKKKSRGNVEAEVKVAKAPS